MFGYFKGDKQAKNHRINTKFG